MRKLTILFALLCASMMSWATQYCDFPTGHENNADFGDANGRILLTLVPTGNSKEYQLTIKPNYANGATKQLDYLYVIAGGNSPYPAEAGADESGTGYDELSVTFTNSNATASFTIQWSNPDWGGRWQCTLTDVVLNELTSCSGGGGSTPDPDPDPTPDPTPVSYCDFPTGHESNPNFGDANGRILLSLEPTGNANEYKLTIKPNYDNGATKKLDYLYVIASGNTPYPAEAGVDESGIGYDELSVTFTNSNATTSFMIQWSNPEWGGRWQCNLNDITLGDLTPCSTPSIASEYCGQAMSSGNTLAKFTWETTDEGNVNITIIEALGGAPSATHFRGNGINIDKIEVGESREPAAAYFNLTCGGAPTITLSLKDPANAPALGSKIYVTSKVIEYTTSLDGNAWPTLSFEYTYGGVCADESVLTEIALNASTTFAKVGESVTLTAQPLDQMGVPMAGSVNYEISPADAGTIVGDVFTFAKTGAVTITASVDAIEKSITLYGVPSDNLALNQPSEGGYYDNNPDEGFDKANDGNTNTSWVTYADKPASVEWWYVDLGDTYSLTAVDVVWGDPSSTSYKVFARVDAPSEEDKADDSAWEEIASVSGIGINSEQFNVVNANARYVRIHSLARTANFLRLKEVRVFGTEYVPVEDTEKPEMTSASLESSTYTEAVINVAATDNIGIYRFHVVDNANGIDANFTPSEGKITINGLTHSTTYNFTITAKDASNNESANSIVVPVTTPFDVTINLALNQPCEGGYYDNNPAESADKANDGNNNTSWVTYGDHAIASDWWIVDLGQVYNLTNITALWANDAYATQYILQARVEAPATEDKADDAAWVTLATVSGVTAGEERSTDVSGVGRYVRFRALAHTGFFRLREFRVYGSGIADVDTEAPVMSSASLVSNTDVQAIIAVSATDNQGIASFHVVDAGNSFEANFVAEGGNITVIGLNGGTTYNFTITAIDFFGNESANNKSVEVTTTAHYTEPQAACPAPTWDASLVKAIYSPTYSADCGFDAWGSGSTAADDTYGKKYTVGNGYFGIVGFSLNCLLMEKLHFDIWVENDVTIQFFPIWGGTEQGIARNLTGQHWNSIDIDMSEYTTITNWGNIYQMKLANMPNGLVLWIANAYFYREAAYVDTEVPTNASASKVAEGFYSVQISAQAEDNSGAVSFVVKNGDVEVATGASASGVATTITVNNLTPGTAYNFDVIVSDEAGNALDPIAISATTKALPAAAPTPDCSGKLVIPVFTDAMAGAPAQIHSGGWGEATIHEWLNLSANNKVFYVQNLNYAGWHSWGADIDATGMQYLHVDVYSIGATSVNVTPISPATPNNHEGVATINLNPNAWTSYDVPLSTYDANDIDWAHIFQFKFMDPVGGNELMIDNVYFFKEPDMVRNDSWMAPGELGTVCIPQGAVATGGDLYTLEGKNSDGKIVFATVPNNEMEPGVPYLFQATSNAMNFFYTDEAEAGTAGNHNGMYGTFSATTITTDLDNTYYFAGHTLWSSSDLTGTGLSVAANRAYIKMSEVPTMGANPAPGRRYIIMDVHGQNATTGFGEVQGDDVYTKVLIDGQLFILRGEKMYNANGQLVK